jgi:acetyl esterase/lipase
MLKSHSLRSRDRGSAARSAEIQRLIPWILRIGVLALGVSATACTSAAFLVANVPASFGDYRRTEGIPYGTDVRHRLDVYTPADAGTFRPVVVFWYGGSWQNGSRSSYRFVGAALAESGFVAVLPDYRLYPQVKFPEFLDDAARAVLWVQQHAEEFGGNPRQIVLMGHSAGAHIAASLALDARYLARAGASIEGIVALVGLSGPYALEPNSRTLRDIFGSPHGPADWQPIRHVTHVAPPTFLAHGLDDFLVASAHTERLRDALRMHDVPVEAHLYPERGHAVTVAAFSKPARSRVPVLEQAVRFIRGVTQTPPAAAANAAQTGPSRSPARW